MGGNQKVLATQKKKKKNNNKKKPPQAASNGGSGAQKAGEVTGKNITTQCNQPKEVNGNTSIRMSETGGDLHYNEKAAIAAPKSHSFNSPPESLERSHSPANAPPLSHHSESGDDKGHEEEILGSDDEEQEDSRDYRAGGYHPVDIGDVFNSRYRVIRKLGWGHFSTVWLCIDRQANRFVAMKIVKSAAHYTEAALDEVKLLLAVRDADREDVGCEKVVQLLDQFEVEGVNGRHVAMVFEVLGCNLLKLIIRSNYRGLHLEQVRKICKQVLEGLRYLHEKCQIIHTDIKPENVLVTMSEDEVKAMAQHAAFATKMNLKLSGSAVSTAPTHLTKQLTKSKKKKLKRKKKKNISALENELHAQGLPIDMDALTNTYTKVSECEEGIMATRVQDLSDIDEGVNFSNNQKQVSSPVHNNGGAASPRSDDEFEPRGSNYPINFEDPLSPSHPIFQPIHGIQEPGVLPAPPVGPDMNDPFIDIHVKIADLGNACWTHHHFTDDIQTRQYRALEVLIGAGYGPPADIWSTACMAFELATGDYLFEPHQGENYSRDEDHLAHISELLGEIPPSVFKTGAHWKDFFTKNGRLLHISQLKPWPLYDVLRQKYDWSHEDAEQFSSFLTPMLTFDQGARATAGDALKHSFLKPFGGRNQPSDCPPQIQRIPSDQYEEVENVDPELDNDNSSIEMEDADRASSNERQNNESNLPSSSDSSIDPFQEEHC
ncbi:unnamed protein product [Caenorhabditis auriculariae]|uniref:non-specific serine/threonine protein kinase n=1 Tax=Caenorhabditis auriculariae TaxID=2777116 RepID=A0A8S1GWQ9_9PELO|nr:unnamed protein product [Caenorhabditis auriculariae]